MNFAITIVVATLIMAPLIGKSDAGIEKGWQKKENELRAAVYHSEDKQRISQSHQPSAQQQQHQRQTPEMNTSPTGKAPRLVLSNARHTTPNPNVQIAKASIANMPVPISPIPNASFHFSDQNEQSLGQKYVIPPAEENNQQLQEADSAQINRLLAELNANYPSWTNEQLEPNYGPHGTNEQLEPNYDLHETNAQFDTNYGPHGTNAQFDTNYGPHGTNAQFDINYDLHGTNAQFDTNYDLHGTNAQFDTNYDLHGKNAQLEPNYGPHGTNEQIGRNYGLYGTNEQLEPNYGLFNEQASHITNPTQNLYQKELLSENLESSYGHSYGQNNHWLTSHLQTEPTFAGAFFPGSPTKQNLAPTLGRHQQIGPNQYSERQIFGYGSAELNQNLAADHLLYGPSAEQIYANNLTASEEDLYLLDQLLNPSFFNQNLAHQQSHLSAGQEFCPHLTALSSDYAQKLQAVNEPFFDDQDLAHQYSLGEYSDKILANFESGPSSSASLYDEDADKSYQQHQLGSQKGLQTSFCNAYPQNELCQHSARIQHAKDNYYHYQNAQIRDFRYENAEMLHGNAEMLSGNAEMLSGNAEMLSGNAKMLHGNAEIFLENAQMLSGNAEVLPADSLPVFSNDKLKNVEQIKNDQRKMKRPTIVEEEGEAGDKNREVKARMEKKVPSNATEPSASAKPVDPLGQNSMTQNEREMVKFVLQIVNVTLFVIGIAPSPKNGIFEPIMNYDKSEKKIFFAQISKSARNMDPKKAVTKIKKELLGNKQTEQKHLCREMIGEIDSKIEKLFGQSLFGENRGNIPLDNDALVTNILFFYCCFYRKLGGLLEAPFHLIDPNQLMNLPKKSEKEALIIWLIDAMSLFFKAFQTSVLKRNLTNKVQIISFLTHFGIIEKWKEEITLVFFSIQMTIAPLIGGQIIELEQSAELFKQITEHNIVCLIMERAPTMDMRQIVEMAKSVALGVSYARTFQQRFLSSIRQLVANNKGKKEPNFLIIAKIYAHFYGVLLNIALSQKNETLFPDAQKYEDESSRVISQFLIKSIGQLNGQISQWERQQAKGKSKSVEETEKRKNLFF